MTFRVTLAIAFASLPSLLLADHEDIGVLRVVVPTIGAPDTDQMGFNETYNGLRLTISNDIGFSFDVGNAVWIGQDGLQVVDTPTEQSFFTNDPAQGFPLQRNVGFETAEPNAGLLIGSIFSRGNFDTIDILNSIQVEYRLTGSEEILSGSTSATLFIPEPKSAQLLVYTIPLLFLCRTRKRGLGHQREIRKTTSPV